MFEPLSLRLCRGANGRRLHSQATAERTTPMITIRLERSTDIAAREAI